MENGDKNRGRRMKERGNNRKEVTEEMSLTVTVENREQI